MAGMAGCEEGIVTDWEQLASGGYCCEVDGLRYYLKALGGRWLVACELVALSAADGEMDDLQALDWAEVVVREHRGLQGAWFGGGS